MMLGRITLRVIASRSRLSGSRGTGVAPRERVRGVCLEDAGGRGPGLELEARWTSFEFEPALYVDSGRGVVGRVDLGGPDASAAALRNLARLGSIRLRASLRRMP